MRRAQITVEPHPVGHALDQAARASPLGVPLVAVDELVGQDARDLVGEARGGVDRVDVVEREVDLFVVVVEGGLDLGRSGSVRGGSGGQRRVRGIEMSSKGRVKGPIAYPCGVGYTAHVSQNERHRPCRGAVCVLVGGGLVQQAQDIVYGGGDDRGGVHGREELGCARVAEVVDLEAEFGLGELLGHCRGRRRVRRRIRGWFAAALRSVRQRDGRRRGGRRARLLPESHCGRSEEQIWAGRTQRRWSRRKVNRGFGGAQPDCPTTL